MLVGLAGEHDVGLGRVFDIQIARIGTEHLACCAADNHHMRPGLDPMLVRMPFGGIVIARACVATAGNIDRSKYDRLVDMGWLTPFKTNISDVEYQATDKGRAAAVTNGHD